MRGSRTSGFRDFLEEARIERAGIFYRLVSLSNLVAEVSSGVGRKTSAISFIVCKSSRFLESTCTVLREA